MAGTLRFPSVSTSVARKKDRPIGNEELWKKVKQNICTKQPVQCTQKIVVLDSSHKLSREGSKISKFVGSSRTVTLNRTSQNSKRKFSSKRCDREADTICSPPCNLKMTFISRPWPVWLLALVTADVLYRMGITNSASLNFMRLPVSVAYLMQLSPSFVAVDCNVCYALVNLIALLFSCLNYTAHLRTVLLCAI